MKNYQLDIEHAEIGANGLATKAGWIKTYIVDPVTREYLNATMEHVYFDVSVSAGAYVDAPELPTKTGVAVVRSKDGSKWEVVSDSRGKTAYHTESLQPVIIDFIGELPKTLTLLAPETEFDKWNGKQWETDFEAQKSALVAKAEDEKSQRLDEANKKITDLQDAIDVGLALDGDVEKLQEWKKYRVLLNRVNTSLAPDIEWPQKP